MPFDTDRHLFAGCRLLPALGRQKGSWHVGTASLMDGLAQVLAAVIVPFAIVMVAGRRRLIRAFREEGASQEASAVQPPRVRPLGDWWTGRLLGAAVLRKTSDGRVWLDESAWSEYRARRRRKKLATVLSLAVALLSLYALGILGE